MIYGRDLLRWTSNLHNGKVKFSLAAIFFASQKGIWTRDYEENFVYNLIEKEEKNCDKSENEDLNWAVLVMSLNVYSALTLWDGFRKSFGEKSIEFRVKRKEEDVKKGWLWGKKINAFWELYWNIVNKKCWWKKNFRKLLKKILLNFLKIV